MEKEIVAGEMGKVAKYDVAFKEGKLVAELMHDDGMLSAGLKVAIDAEKVLDALAAAIHGTIDDALIGVVKAALKA